MPKLGKLVHVDVESVIVTARELLDIHIAMHVWKKLCRDKIRVSALVYNRLVEYIFHTLHSSDLVLFSTRRKCVASYILRPGIVRLKLTVTDAGHLRYMINWVMHRGFYRTLALQRAAKKVNGIASKE